MMRGVCVCGGGGGGDGKVMNIVPINHNMLKRRKNRI